MIYFEAAVHGLLLGGLFAAVALGLSLIFGIMNILNLAHGAFIAVGAYVVYVSQTTLGIHPLLSLPLGVLVGFVAGYLIYRWGGTARVARGPVFMVVVYTFGLELIVVNSLAYRYETTSRIVNMPSFMQQTWSILGMRIPAARLYVAIAAVLVTLLINWWIQHTKSGRSVRAVRQDREMAAMNGVDILNTYALTFGIGTAVTALAGVLVSYTAPISPQTGVDYLVAAFAVAIIGGLGNINSIIPAGFLYGVAINVTSVAFGAGIGASITFLLLLIVLLIRPQGLFGSEYY